MCSSWSARVDQPSSLVGSHRGIGAWEMFFALLVQRGLTSAFTGFGNSAEHWAQVAAEVGERPIFIDRNLAKWRSRDSQRVAEDEMLLSKPPQTAMGHRLFSLATTSDRWSSLSGWMGRGTRLTTDRGDIVIRPNLDMAVIGTAASRAVTSTFPATAFGERIADQHRQGMLSEDGYWYASRVLDIIREANR